MEGRTFSTFGDVMMTKRLRTIGFVGALAFLGLTAGASVAHAGGCCGGGRASYSGGGRTFGRASNFGYSGSGMSCGAMGNMSLAPARTNGVGMQGMPMGGYPAPAPAAASASYTCPMHPGVVSATPASCPYCGMALTRR